MNERERVAWWLELARRYPVQQFGQLHDARAHDGGTACTDTILQVIIRGWLGATAMTIDRIRDLAGYTDAQYAARSGLTAPQVQRVVDRLGLPYVVRHNLDAAKVLRWANYYGPVLVGIPYSQWPEWYGFHYRGLIADGKPNGYAAPRARAGKTQLSGFTGAHAVLVLGYSVTRDSSGTIVTRTAYVKEPNHGSGMRPERPPFDAVSARQFKRAYDGFSSILGRRPYAVVPVERFVR